MPDVVYVRYACSMSLHLQGNRLYILAYINQHLPPQEHLGSSLFCISVI